MLPPLSEVDTFCLALPTFSGLGAVFSNALVVSDWAGEFVDLHVKHMPCGYLTRHTFSCQLSCYFHRQWDILVDLPVSLHLACVAFQNHLPVYPLPPGL